MIASVENCGLLFTDNNAGVTGTDGGYSIAIGDRAIWIFGDVFLKDPHAPDGRSAGNVSNCALVTRHGAGPSALRSYTFITEPATGVARQVIPRLSDEDTKVRLWPLGGWYSAADKRVYLYYVKVIAGGTGPFGFHAIGQGLAQASSENPAKLTFTRIPGVGGDLIWWPQDSGVMFGNAVVRGARDGVLYCIGVAERNGKKFGKLARVKVSDVNNIAAYSYYAGGGRQARWSHDSRDATDVIGLTDFPNELSVAYNAYLGGYLAVHSIGVSERLRLSLARDPWGPYEPIGEVAAPHFPFTNSFCYAGKAHPEMDEAGGRTIYVTYVDSGRYWLQMLKITFNK